MIDPTIKPEFSFKVCNTACIMPTYIKQYIYFQLLLIELDMNYPVNTGNHFSKHLVPIYALLISNTMNKCLNPF